jgi:hypothetical protein
MYRVIRTKTIHFLTFSLIFPATSEQPSITTSEKPTTVSSEKPTAPSHPRCPRGQTECVTLIQSLISYFNKLTLTLTDMLAKVLKCEGK